MADRLATDDRLAGEHGRAAHHASPMAVQLNDLARGLRGVTEAAHRLREQEALADPDIAGSSANAECSEAGDETPMVSEPASAMPQILQQPPRPQPLVGEMASPHSGPSLRQLIAPAVLAFALIGVAVLMSVSAIDLARVPGLGWVSDRPRPILTAGLKVVPDLQLDLLAGGTTAPANEVEAVRPPLSLDELLFLEHCEELMLRGDVKRARAELAAAASAGNTHAKFALAETFDPNVLAAWGLRDQVADVGTARALYGQALADGDGRAHRRITALHVER